MSVKTICDGYQVRFGGENCVQSLMVSIESIETAVQKKNNALWALSQLEREASLPFLYELKEQKNNGSGTYRLLFIRRWSVL